MTHPTLISPNTGNYRVGKGRVELKREGAMAFVHMGNCTTFEIQPSTNKLDHFSSMEGLKKKDASVVIETGGTVKINMEEWTPNNLSLMLLGEVDEGAVGGPTVDILALAEIKGELKFTSTNEVGPKWNFHLYNVSFSPSGSVNPISDEWGAMEVTGEILASQTVPNVGKFGFAQETNIDS